MTTDKQFEDFLLGQNGVPTGTVYNEMGLQAGGHNGATSYHPPGSQGTTGQTGGASSRGSYELHPFSREIVDATPRWVFVVLALVGAVGGFLLLNELTNPATGSNAEAWIGAAVGALFGWILIPLAVGVVDITVRLAWLLLKLALGLGFGFAILWVVTQLI
jgi:hypothetical protein